MVLMKGVPVEETEEGEVDDGSEPEDVDSDPSSPTDGSRIVHNRGSRSIGTGTNVKSKLNVGNKMEHRSGFQGSEPQKLGISNSNATYSSFDKTPVKSVSDVSTSVSQSTQTKLPSEESKIVPKILRTEAPSVSAAQPYFHSTSIQVQQIPLPPLPDPKSTVVGGPGRHASCPPNTQLVTPSGSPEEIEQMHKMYQKACELYDKAVEKIKASGLNLPTSLLPRPPAPFTHLAIGNTVNPGNLTTVTPGVNGTALLPGLLLPPPPPLISSSQNSTASGPPPRPPNPTLSLVSPTLIELSSDPAYKDAYAAAYQQTMKAIPTPQNGGPTPDTPEFVATWQRYMDHYLRYYLRTSALNVPNTKHEEQPSQSQSQQEQEQEQRHVQRQTQQQEQQMTLPTFEKESDQAPKTDGIPLPTTPLNNQTSESIGGQTPSNLADIALPPSPKRPRSTDAANTSVSKTPAITPSVVEVSKDDKKNNLSPVQDSGQHEVSKVKQSDESSDLNESKYVWMSNLPQGVKAVDIKDRCTPFGRVQTIKIIGSRKSKPPSIYAYLIMETPEAAGRLINGLQGTSFGDNQVKLKRILALPIP